MAFSDYRNVQGAAFLFIVPGRLYLLGFDSKPEHPI